MSRPKPGLYAFVCTIHGSVMLYGPAAKCHHLPYMIAPNTVGCEKCLRAWSAQECGPQPHYAPAMVVLA